MYYRYGSCYVYGYFARLGIEVTKTEEKKREFKDELTDTWFVLGIVFGAFLVVGTLFMYLFGDKIAFQGRQCAFLTITHLYCPGCGGTRALQELIRFHFISSLLCNPLVLLGSLALLFYDVLWVSALIKDRPFPIPKKPRKVIRTVIIVLLLVSAVGYMVIRDYFLIRGEWDFMGDLLSFWTQK